MKSKRPLIAVLVIVALVLAGVFWFKRGGLPPIPPVPAAVRAKAEPAVFPVIAKYEKIGGETVSEYGTCFHVEPAGTFLTCAHVINASPLDSSLVGVSLLMDGKERPAEVVSTNTTSDVAVLRVADYQGSSLQMNRKAPAVDSACFLFGYPTRYAGMAIPKLMGTGAFVEEGEREYEIGGKRSPAIRLRGTSDFGGSGGPLLDESGLVRGMVFASRFTDESKRNTSHIFLIPSRVLTEELERSQHVSPVTLPAVPTTNLDGDEFVDSQDATPLVADYPTVEILIKDFGIGLKPNLRRAVQLSEISVGETEMRQTQHFQRETYEGMVTRSSVSSTRYSGGLNAGVRGNAGPQGGVAGISLRYSGSHLQEAHEQIRTQRTETTVKTSELAKISSRLKSLSQLGMETFFSAESGYVKLTIAIRNPSHVDCVLTDFAVNVVTGNKIWQTLHARTQGRFEPKHLAPLQHESEVLVVEFRGLNTHEVETLLQNQGDLDIAFEIVPSSVKIGDGLSFGRLSKIFERCALVEVEANGGSQQAYVSAMKDRETPSLALEDLIQRVPRKDTAVKWEKGPLGDSLAMFMGKPGLAILLPDDRPEGRWLVFHNGEELIDSWRSREVHPGDSVTFRYLNPSDYWGDPSEWRGYVAAYTQLRTIADAESRFWDEVYSFNRPEKPTWNVQTQNQIRGQAQMLRDQYEMFFNSPTLPGAIRRRWPNASDRIHQFNVWFAGIEPQLPQFDVTVERMNAWWNVDQKLSPWVELKAGGEEIVASGGFVYDDHGMSGRIPLTPEAERGRAKFTWVPFREVEFRLIDDGTINNTNLIHFRASDFQALEALLDVHSFDAKAIENIDPAVSQAELRVRIEHDNKTIPQDDFADYFATILPRPIKVVPKELSPKLLAFDFWVDHRPVGYAHSAAVFEELYDSRRGHPDELANLARAIVANFRCFNFARCVELGENLPPVGGEEGVRVFPDTSLADLREISLVAEELAKLDKKSDAFLVFARAMLHGQSYQRLDYLASKPLILRAIGHDLTQKWASELKSRLADDAAVVAQIRDDFVRAYAVKLIDDSVAGLENLKLEN